MVDWVPCVRTAFLCGRGKLINNLTFCVYFYDYIDVPVNLVIRAKLSIDCYDLFSNFV